MTPDEVEIAGEALAGVALSSALMMLLMRKRLLQPTEARELLDGAQLLIGDMFPNHPGQASATTVLEGLIQGVMKIARPGEGEN